MSPLFADDYRTQRGGNHGSIDMLGGPFSPIMHLVLSKCIIKQASLAAPDTIRSKRSFEQESGLNNVTVKKYHGDNGIFKSAEFLDETTQLVQEISFSGVGAHHQNVKAERAIKTVFF
jgi:hypothetical protein